ncbi:MAG TPA: hypothetical protein H9829_03260 [Candidatus Tetragenococcus pullicola]|nr:hypothetical protein [Candidatus Tetragenococcus pullicola]
MRRDEISVGLPRPPDHEFKVATIRNYIDPLIGQMKLSDITTTGLLLP